MKPSTASSTAQDIVRLLLSVVATLLLSAAALAGLAAHHRSQVTSNRSFSSLIPAAFHPASSASLPRGQQQQQLALTASIPAAFHAAPSATAAAVFAGQQQQHQDQQQRAAHLADCPAWFLKYESFHAAAKGKPGTKYLIHEVPEHKVGKSGGFGDRLRGMLYALRLAVASDRVLLFSWERPVELHQLLVPSGRINWTLEGIPEFTQEQQQKALVLRFMNGAYHPMVLNGSLTSLADPFVIVQTNQRMDAQCKACPALLEMAPSTACVWKRLFKPTDTIQDEAQQELQRAFNSSSPEYVAVHLRLGGFAGEGEHERGSGPLKNFAGALRCAHRLAAQHNISSNVPVLMVTDNQHLRTFLQQGHVPGVLAPSTEPVHIDQALHLDHNATAHRGTVVDLLLLSKAACLVTSPGYKHGGLSGFSHHGWLLGGGKPCHIDFRDCI